MSPLGTGQPITANTHHVGRLVTLAILLFFAVATSADKKKDAPQLVAPACPMPDALLPIPAADKALRPAREATRQEARFVPTTCGIDVSHYQGTINWQMVAIDQNVKYVYIKATESSSLVDSHFRHNVRQARANGLPVGVYHFFSPTASAAMQFANFSQQVANLKVDLVPIVDVEKRGRGSLALFQGRLKTFLRDVEKLYGVKPIIYTGVNFYNKHLAGQFRDYRFMIARYGEDVPTLSEDVPILLWQFTDRGSVSGIHGHVDRSCFVGRYSVQDIMLPGSK